MYNFYKSKLVKLFIKNDLFFIKFIKHFAPVGLAAMKRYRSPEKEGGTHGAIPVSSVQPDRPDDKGTD
jgi:hypothetical protein